MFRVIYRYSCVYIKIKNIKYYELNARSYPHNLCRLFVWSGDHTGSPLQIAAYVPFDKSTLGCLSHSAVIRNQNQNNFFVAVGLGNRMGNGRLFIKIILICRFHRQRSLCLLEFHHDKIHRLRRGVSSSQKISGITLIFREPCRGDGCRWQPLIADRSGSGDRRFRRPTFSIFNFQFSILHSAPYTLNL